MRVLQGFPLIAAALICFGQAPRPPAASEAPIPAVAQAGAPAHAAIVKIENHFEDTVNGLDAADAFNTLGSPVGVYLPGTGVVVTMPLDLIATPRVSPFHQIITPVEKTNTHKRKSAHLPVLRKALQDLVKSAAKELNALPAGERIVFAVSLFYFDWEDKTGLPNQIIASADISTALSGRIQLDEQ